MRAQLPAAKLHQVAGNSGASDQANEQPRESPADRIKAWRWEPGKSGNPGGRPKRDVAAEIARAIFEGNSKMVYEALAKRVGKGDPYAFKELAERGYGKLTEKHEISAHGELLERLMAGRKKVQGRKGA